MKSRKMNGVLRVFGFALISIVLCDDFEENRDAKLRFYYSSLEHFTELPIDEAQKIFSFPWYNSTRTTVIFAHGFTGRPDGPAVTAVISSYLKFTESNVILLNWQHLAQGTRPNLGGSYTSWAAPNARTLGVRMADTLHNLYAAGMNLNTTHLVGHSLGAHIFGIAGTKLQERGILLPWITGLDPAGTGFEGRPTRLHANSARFVAAVHSDPNKYGFTRSIGTVDFWPNYRNIGPVRQPGCDNRSGPMFSPEDLCSHNRCWELLVDSMKYPGSLLGSYARNFRTWKNYSAEERNAIVLEIGRHYDNVSPGNYYFVTNSESPYGLGKNGL